MHRADYRRLAEGVSAYRVEEAFEAHAATVLVATDVEPPRVLAIDESAFKKRPQTLPPDPCAGLRAGGCIRTMKGIIETRIRVIHLL